MTQLLGADFSYARPSPAALKAAGYSFVLRYLSWEPGKNITAAELAEYHAAGIAVGFVWESTADRPLYGAANGAADGAEAGRQLRAMGVPTSVPIFWALDTDDRGFPGIFPTLKAYGDAFAHACGHFSFPYGSVRVINYFEGGWQTEAWSVDANGTIEISPHAYLFQRAGGARIANTDEDVLFNSYALYLPVQPGPIAPPEETEVIYPGTIYAADLKRPYDFDSRGIRALQGLLQASGLLIDTDNTNRLVLIQAIKRVQQLNKWPETGTADSNVWAWLLRSTALK